MRLGRSPRWLEQLAAALPPEPDEGRDVALRVLGNPPDRARRYLPFEQRTVRRPWPVPRIDTVTALAAFLDLHLGELLWLADARGLERSVASEKLRNYRSTWIPRRGGPPRVIEQPKASLKAAQRRVLHELLDAIRRTRPRTASGAAAPCARTRGRTSAAASCSASTSRTSSRPSTRGASSASSARPGIPRASPTS